MINDKWVKTLLKALVLVSGLLFFLVMTDTDLRAQTPVAAFSANTTMGCSPLTVNFTNSSTQATNYLWNFGNGNTSTLQDPTTVYVSPGTYTVTLIAINTLSGERDTVIETDYIFVPDNPVSDFSAPVLTGCVNNNSISFNNMSIGAVNYIWDFGDGGFSTLTNPTHIYTTPGTYTVKLIAENVYGCTNVKTMNAYITINPAPVAGFSVSQQSSCDQNQQFSFFSNNTGATSWFWDFGDGNTSTQQNPVHTYGSQGGFSVTHIVTNSFGCADTIIEQAFINIGATLVPTFTVSNQSGCAPLTTSFNSTVAGGTSWLWDFGDGTSSVLENPQHTYISPGNYNITLTATTSSGCDGSASFSGFITVEAVPDAQFTISNGTGCSPHTVTFNNTSTGGDTWYWDFGNGITSTDENPQILFADTGIFDVMLIVSTLGGCSDTLQLSSGVTINSIEGSMSANPDIGCSPLPVDFTGASVPNAITWFWDFGDGNTSSQQNPSHIYNGLGSYDVSLVVTSAEGCVDTVFSPDFINVVSGSTPYVLPDTVIVCTPPGLLNVVDPTIGSNSWLWNFGDGSTSTLGNPQHNYTIPGIYNVTLTTGMAGGCIQTFDPFLIVNVLEFITTPILTNITSLCGPFTVEFDNTTSNVASYLWDFGDGNTSTLQNPTHTYASQGTYNITLLLTAINGCQVTLGTTVTFGYDLPISISTIDACQGDSIFFNLQPAGAFTSAIWYFGDGGSSNLLNPGYVYNAEGQYEVSVTVTDTNGCVFDYISPDSVLITNPVPAFSVNQPTEGCIPFSVTFTNNSTGAISYLWDFGDGGTSTSENPTHNYTIPGVFTVSLTVTNSGCTRDLSIPDIITANQAVADFSFTPNTGCLPLTVTYTDLSVNPVSWFWEFGDGTTSTLQNPVHTFTIDPPGNVKLTIVDINGCTRLKNKNNINPVIPEIVVSDSIGCRPLTIDFSTPTAAASYLWDFGDGNTSTLQNPTHTYLQNGVFTVTLTCILASGCTTSTGKPDFIEVIAPESDFMSPTVSVCAPSLVDFVNQSTNAVAWLWNFGDGTTSTNENPSHIYDIPGTYTVTLISYTAEGCADTLIKLDYIVVPGTYSDFTLGSGVNCLNTMVQFIDQSINATSWFWNFGDGFTSTLQNPLHLYADTGNYVVTLITSDSTGCSSFFSGSNPVTIHPIPQANGTIGNTTGCQPLNVQFNNSSSGSVGYVWHFGNGDSSLIENTFYNYTDSGSFTPYLVALNTVGCTDTIYFPGGVKVNPVPQAGFSVGNVQGCTPFGVTFTNTSGNLSAPTYEWNFGNSLVSNIANPSTVYADSGIYNISLIVINAEGCRDTVTSSVTANQSPVASAVVSDSSGCAPLEITFINASLYASNVFWDFGDSNTSTNDTVTHLYSIPGTYNPILIAYSTLGCTDTFSITTPVMIHPIPEASFTVNQSAGCPGTTFELINTSLPDSGLAYSWNISGSVFSIENPDITLSNPGFYNASLIVTNPFGCTDTSDQTNYIQVYDSIPPPVSPIAGVSVLSDTEVEITWLNSAALDLGAYVLYRQDLITGLYNEVYRDTTPMNSVLNVTSTYVDGGLNTLQNVYTYKLQTLDYCSYALPLSVLIPHSTINVSAAPVGFNILVNWTEYKGCNIASYELNRVNMVTGSSVLIATVPPTVRSFIDQGFPCPHEFMYRVTATELCGNTFKSFSDTANARPANVLANQKVEVVRSTVINDRDVLTEWLPPSLAPERVQYYNIFRSVDNVNFVLVNSVPSGVASFVDYNVMVHDQEYYYKIEVVSDCDVSGAPSNESSSIWLQSEHENDITKLWWTPYTDWNSGVEYYIIERENWAGQWELIKQVPGTTIEVTFDD